MTGIEGSISLAEWPTSNPSRFPFPDRLIFVTTALTAFLSSVKSAIASSPEPMRHRVKAAVGQCFLDRSSNKLIVLDDQNPPCHSNCFPLAAAAAVLQQGKR
jgi:hypothetical protein